MKNRFLSDGCPKKRQLGGCDLFFFLLFISLLTRIYRKFKGKKTFFNKYEKKSSSRPFLAHSGGRQETPFYLRMA